MTRLALLVASLLLALASLLWLDGWYALPGTAAASAAPPAEMPRALSSVADDLGRRAEALASDPEVRRSLAGGGIAFQRQRLFAAARTAMADAPPGSWIALADPAGNLLAWWGEAPTRMPEVPAGGVLSVRWSATRMELDRWRRAGTNAFPGVICAARSVPVDAPAFGQALGLGAGSQQWDAVAPSGDLPLVLTAGTRPLVAVRRGAPATADRRERLVGFAALLVVILPMLAGGPAWLGVGLAAAYLATASLAGPAGVRLLGEPTAWLLALGPFFLPIGLAALARPPESGAARWR
ncbi:MAG: hypothetical protein ACM3NW_04450, partial [Syntrophomonadaceae bacterium]